MNKLKNSSQILIPILLGIAAFIFVTGGKIVWPSNINWLRGDAVEALCAWEFFRYTPVLQNPLGSNYPYGMGIAGSVIYGDPLFIFSFPFKLFSSVLPTPFQYFGIWVFLCFILQAIFSWKLLEKITDNQWFKFLGSIFFVLSPVFLSRYTGIFFLGQWLILAAIWLYLSLRFRSYAWCALLCTSSLVHAYFLFMLLTLWIADLINRKILIELTYLQIIKHFFLTALILLIVMWQAGYFMLHSGYVGPGLGLYRMNLLSFIDPFTKEYSYLLRGVFKHTAGDYEGFSYLGLGMIILGIFALAELLKSIKEPEVKIIFFNVKKIIPLISVSFLLMVFALSNRIVLGRYELIQYKLPEIAGIFRATGRMALPMYYLIYLGIFYLIIKCYKKETAIVLFFICLFIQITDSYRVFTKLRHWSNKHAYNSPLKSSVWSQAANKYKKIFYTLPEIYPKDWEAITRYAAFNKLSINAGYFARLDVEGLNKNRVALMNDIFHGKLDKDAIYIIRDKKILSVIADRKMKFPYKISKSDGYFLVLPNWPESSTEDRLEWANYYHPYVLGTKISFQKSDKNFKDSIILIKGWSIQEDKGIWTDSSHSFLILKLDKKTNSDLILTIEGSPYINDAHPTLEIDVVVNHKNIGTLIYNIDNLPISIIGNLPLNKQVIIPKSLIYNNILNIEFIFNKVISPKQLKLSSDDRKLGLFVSSLKLTKN